MSDIIVALSKAMDKHKERTQIKTIITGRVTKVNNEKTCNVEIAPGVELYDVRLHAAIDNLQNKITTIPKNNSEVLVAILENLKHEAVVISYNEILLYRIKNGNATFLVKPDKIKIEAGGNNLKTELHV